MHQKGNGGVQGSRRSRAAGEANTSRGGRAAIPPSDREERLPRDSLQHPCLAHNPFKITGVTTRAALLQRTRIVSTQKGDTRANADAGHGRKAIPLFPLPQTSSACRPVLAKPGQPTTALKSCQRRTKPDSNPTLISFDLRRKLPYLFPAPELHYARPAGYCETFLARNSCEPPGARTQDPRLKRPMLYLLS